MSSRHVYCKKYQNIIDICEHFTIISTQMADKQHLIININKMRHYYLQHQLSDNIIAIKVFYLLILNNTCFANIETILTVRSNLSY